MNMLNIIILIHFHFVTVDVIFLFYSHFDSSQYLKHFIFYYYCNSTDDTHLFERKFSYFIFHWFMNQKICDYEN